MSAGNPRARRFDPLLHLDEGGALRSRRFDDIYFQPGDGAQESRAVFLDGCGLPQAWRDRRRFVIGETGFGSGLNFLLTWDAWRRTAGVGQRLHYVAVEGYPLTPDELQSALASWPVLERLAARLGRQYSHLTRGFERLHFDSDRVSLTLLIGDAAQVLEQLEAAVDAWYLDGFAPRRNPQMWSEAVFEQVARLSSNGARLATFSTAGSVRRGLEAVGFEVLKKPGYGAKRERLTGVFKGCGHSLCPAWAAAPAAIDTQRPVNVLGAGVAGLSLAKALSRRTSTATIIEAGGGASLNPAALVMPRLEAGSGHAGRLFWSAYRYALRHWGDRGLLRPEGVLLVARDAKEQRRQERIVEYWGMHRQTARVVSAGDAGALADVPLSAGGLWFAEGGRIDGRDAAYQAPPAVVRRQGFVHALAMQDGCWKALDAAGQPLAAAGELIIATGASARPAFPGDLPLQHWRGQATAIAANAASSRLRTNLVCGRYLTAAHEISKGRSGHWLGASFARQQSDQGPSASDNAENLAALVCSFPELAELGGQPPQDHWWSVRSASPDRLPVVGPLVDAEAFRRQFAWLRHRATPLPAPAAIPPSGLHGLLALGARGFTSAPLLAEWLASVLYGDPWPLERDLVLAVHASRFLARELRRGP